MANKKFWSGMLIMALVLGTAIIGCDNAANDGSVGSTGSTGSEKPDITYTVEADGTLDTVTSTQLTFTFSKAVSLDAGNIDIFNPTDPGGGEVKVSPLLSPLINSTGEDTSEGTSWTLYITTVKAGKVRVSINNKKEGIESGRKTVIVHRESGDGSSKEEATTLLERQWEDGYVDMEGETWFKFEAKNGTDYRVQWQDNNDFNGSFYKVPYTAEIKVTAYESDGTTIIFNDARRGWSNPQPVSGVNGMVYLKVEPSYSYVDRSGTFAIRFYDPAIVPAYSIFINYLNLTTDCVVDLNWMMMSGYDEEVSGYRVYRSEAEHGTYTMIADIPDSFEYYVYYTDTEVLGGKTYWYKITAYNKNGIEGDPSDPKGVEVTVPEEFGTLLRVGAGYIEGLLVPMQEDWYRFTAESGKTYEVQWLGSNSVEGYTGMPMVLPLKSDKETYIGEYAWWQSPGTISGESGTIYLKLTSGWLPGTYAIRVVEVK